ncbi:hypothetical protein ERN12_06275 [Rhodobacteraceae bacterium]|nr:hypothetical protein ERN12_06275 [Paracoccaceae bacterium]
MMLPPRKAPQLQLIAHRITLDPPALMTRAHDVAGNAVAKTRFLQPKGRLINKSRATLDQNIRHWPVCDRSAGHAGSLSQF